MNQQEILRDFRRRYEGGYVWVIPPNSDEESLFLVDRITEDRKNIATIELSSPEYGKIILNYGTAHTLRFKYPPVGVFQNGPDAFIFRRVPQRQWVHALYSGNASVVPVFNTIVTARNGGGRRIQGGQLLFDDVLAAFQGVQYTFRDAIMMLGTGKYRSVALRRNFSLCLSPNGPGYILLFWETPVAHISTEGALILMLEKSFEPVIHQVMGD